MKLEVGMYVRTIGGIERLKKENDNGWFFEKSMIIKPDNIEKYIIKASYNIIDILEEGDYVNGNKVIEIEKNYKFIDGTIRDILWTDTKMQKAIWDETIKSIVTKEQFEQMAYKVGD